MKKIILMCLFGLMFSQSELTTREYELYIENDREYPHNIDLESITGYDLDYALIQIMRPSSFSTSGSFRLDYVCDDIGEHMFVEHNPSKIEFSSYTNAYVKDKDCRLIKVFEEVGYSNTLIIAITAEFPIEDTGYIEDGFDFCLVPGNNLVAFPCDNPVSVETAIPELAQAEIEQIIGAGQAATNLNGQFIGSLSNFTPGAGYWFKSSSSMCFNYACAD